MKMDLFLPINYKHIVVFRSLTAFEWSRVRVESGLDDSCLTRHTHNAKCCAALDTIAVRLQQRAAPPLQPRPSPICMVQQCTEQNIHRSLQMDPRKLLFLKINF